MSNVGNSVAIATPILVTGLGVIGGIWAKRLSKRQDQAMVGKTNAETNSIEVATARSLIEDLREMVGEQRVEYEAKLTKTQTELESVSDRQRQVEIKQSMLLAALAAHAPWDEAAWAALKAQHPTYPPPPPIDADGRHMLRGIDPTV